jgi:hypothetical protein
MTFFDYCKYKQKTLEFAWQHFGIQSSLWVKINFDPKIIWIGLDKINVYKINNLKGFMFVLNEPLPN